MNAAQIAEALEAKKSGDGWMAKCVAHDDSTPSMSISEQNGKPLVRCHAGCEQSTVISALRDRGLWSTSDCSQPFTEHLQLGAPTAIYDYHDAAGRHVGRVMRFDTTSGKQIRQCSFQDGGWTWKAMPEPRPLYGLPQLLRSTDRVLIVEGEKCVAAALKMVTNMEVTTWAGGAKATEKTDFGVLKGRDVILWPDNDQPGRDAMDAIARRLAGVAKSVRMFDPRTLGSLPDGWDAADAFADKACDTQAIWEALRTAPVAQICIEQPNEAATRRYELVAVGDLLAATDPPVWTIEGILEQGVHAGLVAPPEHAKSLLALHAAAAVATGQKFHDRTVRPGLAVYLCGEGFNGMRRRAQALELHFGMGLANAPLVMSRTSASLLDAAERNRVREAIVEAQARFGVPLQLLVVDTLSRFIAPGKESDAPDMSAYFQAIDELRGNATAISLHHPGHGDQTRGRGSSNWRASLDTEYTFALAGDVVTVTCSKMKDAEKPAPMSFRIQPSPTTSAHEDGTPIQSVVLVPTDVAPVAHRPTGKNQKRLLAELEQRGDAIWTEKELREIARSIGMHKNSARDAVLGLRQLGYLTETIGGSRLTHRDERPKTDRKHDFVPDLGPKTRDESGVSLETHLSVLSARPSVQPDLRIQVSKHR